MEQPGSKGKVLVGVDGSTGSRVAATWALEEARVRGLGLIAAFAWHIPMVLLGAPGYFPLVGDEIADEGREMLGRVFGELAHDGDPPVELEVVNAGPTQMLRDLATRPEVEAVVVGHEGHGGAGTMLGSVSHALSHHCPKPLVVVPGPKKPGPEPLSPDRVDHIVVGVDGSAGGDAALRWAAGEARARDALLEAVIAWTSPADVLPFEYNPAEPMESRLRRAAGKLLETSIDGLGMEGLRVKRSVSEGRPADALLERASTADLLVVGTRGLGRAREFVLGSVSHTCVHHSPVPVAIVPIS